MVHGSPSTHFPQINVPKLSPRMGDSLSSRSSNEFLPHFPILYFCFSEMSSFKLKLSSFLVSSPSQSSSYSATTSYLPPLPLFRFPRTRFNSRGRVAVVGAAESDKTNYPISGDSKTPNGTLPKTRRVILLEYVQNVQPEFMELFVKRAPQQTELFPYS